jgi:BirA family biotin operon repressor/biotin-[acetyl-CoA-carboxylase] ligase
LRHIYLNDKVTFNQQHIFIKNTDYLQPENVIGEPFYEIGEVDSTNNYAMRQVQAQMAGHGTTWFADYQNSGKGQRGKTWNARPGENILMSCVLEPVFLTVDNQFILNAAVALACFDFFATYAGEEVCIKWPNDIYWKDRKAGGILVENIIKGKHWRFTIAGTGININQTFFGAGLQNPVSLKQITGKSFDVIALAKELCAQMNGRWQQLRNLEFAKIINEYAQHLYKLQEAVTFTGNGETFTAVVKGVTLEGELLVETSETRKLKHGTVEWMLPQVK